MADFQTPDSEAPTFRLQRPDEADDVPTRRVELPPNDDREAPTLRLGNAPISTRRALGYLEKGHLLPRGLKVEATIAPHESARPGVYRCHSPLEGHVVVKVAALNAPPDLQLWRRLPELEHPHVLKVLQVFEGEDDGFFYEIQQWCEGGTLAEKIAPVGVARDEIFLSWIENALVPAFWSGIFYLHEREIIHRDIKPSNLYFRSENGAEKMVIGDFDISSLLGDGRTSRDTARAAGTWTYAAPEAFPRFIDESGRAGSRISRASDFYSFGVVLLELLQGTTPLHGGDFPDVFDFYLAGRRLEVPLLPQKWRDLLGGLLIRDRHARWGAAQLERWMANQTSDEDRAAIASDRGLPASGIGRPFSAFDSRPATLEELASAMLAQPEIAREELLGGDVLLNWIGEIDPLTAREIRRDREIWREQTSVAVLCALLRCNPQTPALIAPEIVAFSALEWSQGAQKAVAEGLSDAETLCHAGALMWLEQWLKLKSPPEIEASKTVSQLRKRREIAESSGAAREIADETPFGVNQSARTTPGVAKGVRSAGYGKARGFALEHEQITPESLAQNCEIAPEAARRLCAQLERDGVLQRILTPDETPIFEPQSQAEVILEEIGYAFEPQKPYFVGLETHARTPQEIAQNCLGGTWSAEPPPLFLAACERWQNGFLEAWLRQRLPMRDGKPNPILSQIEKLRVQAAQNSIGNPQNATSATPNASSDTENAQSAAQNASSNAPNATSATQNSNKSAFQAPDSLNYALFDSVLRLFDPKTAPVALEMSWDSPTILVAPYGETATKTLNWRVRGPGIAFGALELSGALPGLELSDHLICGRAGSVQVVLWGGGNLVAGQNYRAKVGFGSQNARLVKELAPLQYRTDFPREQTRGRVLTGALIGAATLGIPRLVVMLGELNRPATLGGFDYSQIWTQTRGGAWPHLGLVCATILLLGASYGAFRAWLWALRNWGAV